MDGQTLRQVAATMLAIKGHPPTLQAGVQNTCARVLAEVAGVGPDWYSFTAVTATRRNVQVTPASRSCISCYPPWAHPQLLQATGALRHENFWHWVLDGACHRAVLRRVARRLYGGNPGHGATLRLP